MKATDVLEKAAQHMRDRATTYDKPEGERSMAQTVAAFNAITGKFLSVAEGWLFMAVLKQVRVFQNPAKPHQDSLEDGVALMDREELDNYLHQLSDADLQEMADKAVADLAAAAEADPESEWHQACFAGAFVLAQETMRRKQEVLH